MRNFIDIMQGMGSSSRSKLIESAEYWSPERIEKLTQQFADSSFGNAEIARHALLRAWHSARDPEQPGMFNKFEDDIMRKWSSTAPTFDGKNGVHLGAEEHRCPWKDMEIRREDGRYIHDTAEAQSEYDYEIIPIRNYRLDELLGPPDDDRYLKGREGERCRRLAESIKENGWFTAIIVDVSNPKEKFIVEGQHRARAARLLGYKTVPAHGLDFGEDETVNESALMESAGRTLYHGTLMDFVPSILDHGIWPTVGEFTKNAYQESIDAGIDLPCLVFAADKRGINACGSAILDALSRAGYPRTLASFVAHGAIVVLKDRDENDFNHRDRDEDGNYGEHPEQVEPGDYYSDSYVTADRILSGNALVRFMKRYVDDFSHWFDDNDLSAKKAELIRHMIKTGRSDRKSAISQVNAMTPDEVKLAHLNHKYERASAWKTEVSKS